MKLSMSYVCRRVLYKAMDQNLITSVVYYQVLTGSASYIACCYIMSIQIIHALFAFLVQYIIYYNT